MWPTPSAEDNRDRGNMSDPAILRRVDIGKQVMLSMAVKPDTQPGSLNPDWVEWLMGLPIGYTDIDCDEPQEHLGWDEDPAEVWTTPQAQDSKHNGSEPSNYGRDLLAVEVVGRGGRDVRRLQRMDTQVGNGDKHDPSTRQGTDRNIPRLTTVKKNRVNRLKACGNGVVPQQAALAWRLLR